MNLFETSRLAHIAVGTVVLTSFWWAAAARKGGDRHRAAGRVYAIAMAMLLAFTLAMAAGSALGGNSMRAVFNVYVSLISIASVWMAWRSIQDRDDIDRYRGPACKLLCAVLGCYAIFLIVLVPRMGEPARMAMVAAFAVLGLTTAGTLLHRIVRGATHPRWWLSDHLTAMALNFGATHASFSILGLGALFPVVKEPWMRTGILVSWMLAALFARLWAGRRFLGETGKSPRLAAMAPT
jgi:hypothetical protein